MNFLLVGFGGAMGSLTRFSLGRLISSKSKASFPVGTFVINITGAMLLGIVSSLKIDNNTYLFLADGFLGAYTTFSTFMYESFQLFGENKRLNATVYIVSSIILGLIGFAVGAWMAQLLTSV